jgi:hypothetical protein
LYELGATGASTVAIQGLVLATQAPYSPAENAAKSTLQRYYSQAESFYIKQREGIV